MREVLLYHPGYDRLMLATPTHERAHWYYFENDPYGYGGSVAHKLSTLTDDLEWVLLDKWIKPQKQSGGE